MIRGLAILLIILTSTLFVGTNILSLEQAPTVHRAQSLSQLPPLSANASATAFSYTVGQGDLYTNQTNFLATPTTPPVGATATWFSSISHTSTGTPVSGTSLNYTVAAGSAKGKQQYNWTLPNVPKSNCLNCDSTVRFTFAGNLNKGTSANYTLTFTNNSTVISTATHVSNSTFPSPVVSLSCPQLNVCVNVTRYVGFTLRLSFNFGWNGTAGMKVTVGELLVAAISNQLTPSIGNWMSMNGTDPTRVNHTARLFVPLMNSTVQYKNGTGTNILTHVWKNEVLNLYYPAGYQSLKVNLNASASQFFPTAGRFPFEATACNDPPTCTRSLIALNMSDAYSVVKNTNVTILANSMNTLHPTTLSSLVSTAIGTVPLQYFVPGDNLTVKVTNLPSAVNATIQQANPKLNITFTDRFGSNQTIPPSTFTTTTRGGLFGFILPSLPLGLWRYNVTYNSNYDLGTASGTFTIEQMIMAANSFAYSANGNQLSISGKLLYNSSLLPASAVNGTVFAVDSSSGSSPFTPPANSPSQGLYFSNMSMADGVFTSGQALTIFFAVVNPTAPQKFNASLTIDHEWAKGLTHGVNATVPLTLGDQPFTLGQYMYQLDATLLPNGIHVKLTSLLTKISTTATLSNSTSPVVTTRQHTGVFKISIATIVNGTVVHVNSMESPPYAYVLTGPTAGRYLTHSDTFTTAADGSFSATLPANMTVGARRLVLFALARDSAGIVLWNRNQDPTSATDSTALNSSVDRIGEATVRQSVTATIHLTNNSTKISQSITVDLNLQGPGIQSSTKLGSQAISIGPGESKTLNYQFTAPSQPGSYTLTFSSPQYGRPLTSQTLQVVLVQGVIQLLIPLIIGVVAAIVVLGYYLVRKRPVPVAAVKPSGPKQPRTKGTSSLQMFNRTFPSHTLDWK
jgi:hypothetical protein